MSKTIKRPMTRDDAADLLRMAQEQLKDTDGCPICVVSMRVNLNGQMELFTPTISPERIPLDMTIAIIRTYLNFLEEGHARPFEEAPNGPQFREVRLGPRRTSGNIPGVLGVQKPGKHTVN